MVYLASALFPFVAELRPGGPRRADAPASSTGRAALRQAAGSRPRVRRRPRQRRELRPAPLPAAGGGLLERSWTRRPGVPTTRLDEVRRAGSPPRPLPERPWLNAGSTRLSTSCRAGAWTDGSWSHAHARPPGSSSSPSADALGARLCRDAAVGRPALQLARGSRWSALDGAGATSTAPTVPSLYGGTSGIALFLARLYAATGERLFRRTALGALRPALAHGAEEIAPPSRARRLQRLDRPRRRGARRSRAAARRRALPRRRRSRLLAGAAGDEIRPKALDVLAGCAGAIPAAPRPPAGSAARRPAGRAPSGSATTSSRPPPRGDAGWSWGDPASPGVEAARGTSPASRTAPAASAGACWSSTTRPARRASARPPRRPSATSGTGSTPRHGNWPDLRDPRDCRACRRGDAPPS